MTCRKKKQVLYKMATLFLSKCILHSWHCLQIIVSPILSLLISFSIFIVLCAWLFQKHMILINSQGSIKMIQRTLHFPSLRKFLLQPGYNYLSSSKVMINLFLFPFQILFNYTFLTCIWIFIWMKSCFSSIIDRGLQWLYISAVTSSGSEVT